MRANLTLQQLKAFTQPLSIEEKPFQGISSRRKDAVREKLEADIQAYLEAGNAIYTLPAPKWSSASRKACEWLPLETVA